MKVKHGMKEAGRLGFHEKIVLLLVASPEASCCVWEGVSHTAKIEDGGNERWFLWCKHIKYIL